MTFPVAAYEEVSVWQDQANCAGVDTEAFFDTATRKEQQIAKRVCANCPVQPECLEFSLVYNLHGIWGGLTRKERQRRYDDEHVTMLIEDLKESGMYDEYLRS